jgi:hypothetical protein
LAFIFQGKRDEYIFKTILPSTLAIAILGTSAGVAAQQAANAMATIANSNFGVF